MFGPEPWAVCTSTRLFLDGLLGRWTRLLGTYCSRRRRGQMAESRLKSRFSVLYTKQRILSQEHPPVFRKVEKHGLVTFSSLDASRPRIPSGFNILDKILATYEALFSRARGVILESPVYPTCVRLDSFISRMSLLQLLLFVLLTLVQATSFLVGNTTIASSSRHLACLLNCLKFTSSRILLWMETNCAEEQVLIFACLVPGFPAVVSSRGPCTLETLINPSPSAADVFWRTLRFSLPTLEAASLEWKNKENQETGFKFLFTLFRKYYLPHLFPSFTRLTNVYKPVLDIPHSRPKPVYVMTTRDNENIYSTNVPYMAARVVFIKWIVTFFLEKKYLTGTQNTKNGADVLPKIIQTVGGGAGAQERTPELDGGGAAEQDRGPSNSSTLSDRRRSSGSLCSVDEEHRPVYEMVQRILLSTRGYVNFVNEVFRQRRVQMCVRAAERSARGPSGSPREPWEQVRVRRLAAGLTERSPRAGWASALKAVDADSNWDGAVTRKVVHVYRKWILQDKPVFMEEPDIKEAAQEDAEKLGFSETDTKEASSESSGHKRSSSWGRSYSFTSAVSRGCVTEEENRSVKAGAQAALQTLIVAWIRASLCVYVSRELWDDFLGVLSSLTEWDELISEWANIMDSLTVVLARTVYGVEMTNLPLDKLSEQKEKKQRGKEVEDSAQSENAPAAEPGRLAAVEPQHVVRSSSTPDVTGPLCPCTPPGPKVENVQTGSSSEPKPVQENKGHVKKEHEGMTILVRRSSSPAELDLTDDSQQTQGKCRERQKSDSVSSDTALSYSTEAELALSPWPTCEEDPELSSPTDAATDSDARHWLQLSPTDASNLTVFKLKGKIISKALAVFPQRFPSYVTLLPHEVAVWSQVPAVLVTKTYFMAKVLGRFAKFRTLGYSVEVLYVFGESVSTQRDVPGGGDSLHMSPPSFVRGEEDNFGNDCVNNGGGDSSECLADDCSIVAGGTLAGWHPDSAAVLWRRVLGILGDVNNIQSPQIHARVFGYLYELWYKLAKATTLPKEYKEGKLQAYKLICAMMTRRQDVLPSSDFLVHCYLAMHLGLTSDDQRNTVARCVSSQGSKATEDFCAVPHVTEAVGGPGRAGLLRRDVLNTIIRHCPPRFFSLGLPGFSMLLGDFIAAAARVLSADTLAAPRPEALTILGSLVCFPNTYREIPLLQSVPEVTDLIPGTEDVKHYLVSILLKNATEEPNECARCIAICSLGVWICEELAERTGHPQLKEAVNVIGVTLKFPNKIVAQVACDVLQLLVSYWEKLQVFETSLPRKIAEILVATIAFLLPSAEHSSVEADKKFIVSLLLCLLDWCMALPLRALLHPVCTAALEQPSPRAPLLDYVYRVLHCCVCGSSTYTQQSHKTLTLADLSSTDYDPFLPLANVKNSEPVQYPSSAELGNLLTVEEERKRRSLELIPLTARMVMAHLVNHLGHFPLRGGPAVLHSLVSENHDNAHAGAAELSPDVFRSPGLQLFVFNDSTLISCLQTPADGPAGGSPAGAFSDVRVIVRDVSGKYSWDGKLLYGPLQGCSAREGRSPSLPISGWLHPASGPQKELSQAEEGEDVLDQLLENIGHTSPECLLPSQLNLNEPSPPPCGMSHDQEKEIIEAILRQNAQEDEYIQRCNSSSAMRVPSQEQPPAVGPRGAFYFCRLLLDDLGMNSWDRSRETHKIAVFYIAEGQEDKCSILSNERGSQAYEDFVAGLGWEVDLSTHCGFMGGLQRNGSTGQTAPYYATSTVEVIFHVSTRMPSDSDDSLTKKPARRQQMLAGGRASLCLPRLSPPWSCFLFTGAADIGTTYVAGSGAHGPRHSGPSTVPDPPRRDQLRHLGNDEVHIVWSEHSRDYRRGIIPTAFGDVSIIIYPMKNRMFFIAITKKPEVPFFGPLFDGAIVSGKLLPSLICATCINASRAVKCLIPLYQSLYPLTLAVSDVLLAGGGGGE
ncbi:ral GTPase-activating protein subunit alpha-2 [Camelus ferus]|nr:ral GTPase-activating protein subunit alpha-2 [Camelus ferus]